MSLGACSSFRDVEPPLTGYTRFGVPVVAANCYASLTHNDERGYVVFRVERAATSGVDLSYVIVGATNKGVTLSATDSAKRGYDFSAGTYQGLSGGDFYFTSGQFFANNLGQRGVVGVGACSSVTEVTVPTSGYTRFGVAATAGQCYVSLTHNDERDHVVFRVDSVDASTAILTYRVVFSGLGGATLSATDSAKRGYDFSARTYQGLSGGDFYFTSGQFFANNLGQRGVVAIGACTSPAGITPPTSGYTRFGVTATAGQCYAALTHNDERNHIVFRVDAVDTSNASLTYRIASSGNQGVTLSATGQRETWL